MIFQLMFAVITPALITGAFAERAKFSTFLVFMLLWATFVYDPVAHWVWGIGGWLGAFAEADGQVGLKALDFAGGTVVHINAGMAALVAAVMYGKRHGYGREPMEPHDITMVVIGAALLWFGWFGFNAGSALGSLGLPTEDGGFILTASNAFVVTHLAAGTAAVVWVMLSWLISGKPSVVGAAAGAVAGLVAITPAAGFVSPMAAIAIGVGAGARSATWQSVSAPSSASTTRSTWSACTASVAPGALSRQVSSLLPPTVVSMACSTATPSSSASSSSPSA